jgi:hypothetical protein
MSSPVAVITLVVLALVPRPDPPRPSIVLHKEREAIKLREGKALADLAAKLGGDASARIKTLIDPPPPRDGSSRFVPLGEIIPKAGPVSPPELKAIRDDAAKAYFDLATRCLPPAAPHLALADICLRAVVARDPNHAAAWRLLGYVPHDGGWATPFAVAKLAEGYVLHPTYGWVESSWTAHLDRGELPAPYVAGKSTKWLPAAEADALRRDFARGWQITTEHFAIKTNVPMNEAIGFGRRLESLYDLFGSLMADVVGPELSPLVPLAKNPKASPTTSKRRHKIFYFAEREEYIAFLEPTQGPGIHANLGNYLPRKETKPLGFHEGVSFFFRDPNGQLAVTENLDHEVSHQLLFETAGGDKYDADRPNFWVFEGLGTYFETMRPQPDGSLRIGGMIGKRIEVAQDRLCVKGEFVPIGRMTTYNKFLFYGGNGADIYLNYAEAMALAVYFMQAHDAEYREPFLEYARDVYKGRLRAGLGKSLEDRIGIDYGTLARDFLANLKAARPMGESASAPATR